MGWSRKIKIWALYEILQHFATIKNITCVLLTKTHNLVDGANFSLTMYNFYAILFVMKTGSPQISVLRNQEELKRLLAKEHNIPSWSKISLQRAAEYFAYISTPQAKLELFLDKIHMKNLSKLIK